MSRYDDDILELRQRVARLEGKIAFLLEKLNLAYREEPNQGVSPDIIDLVKRGRKIQAIKLYRQETGAGLKQAKDFIDSLEAV
jgi:ribosomal protein L7/L12